MSENGEIYTVGKNFTLPPAVTEGTNLASESLHHLPIAIRNDVLAIATQLAINK